MSVLACSFEGLTQVLQGPGRAKSVWTALKQGLSPWQMTSGKRQKYLLSTHFSTFPEKIASMAPSPCGTTKLTIQLSDNLEVETVLIPMNGRTTLCISSQVGCARGCTFCSTGQMGLVRNLTAHEILFQVYAALNCLNQPQSNLPDLRNIVFMGMGEPLNNWKNVKKAVQQLIHPMTFAFGPKRITLSTVGPSPKHIEYLNELPIRFAWSLHAALDYKRKALIPTTKAAVAELADAFKSVLQTRKDGLFIELTLIKDKNDTIEDAHALVRCIAALPNETRVNLIPVNPTPHSGDMPPAPETIAAFRAVLHDAGYFCSVRPTRGQSETAACGQLVTLRTSSS